MQHTRQTDPLTEQPRKYKDITLHSPQFRSKRQQNKVKNNNSQGPDKLNIRHLKHISLYGLVFLSNMFKLLLTITIYPT